MVSFLAVFIVSVLSLKTFINTGMTVAEAGDACVSFAGICAGIVMLSYFCSLYLHDRQILKIVDSYGKMLDEFCESLIVADVRATWVDGAGWVFSLDQIVDVKERAKSYLESWALWIIYNESLDTHSEETGISRAAFKRYYHALERIGLVSGGYDPIYKAARARFESAFAPGVVSVPGLVCPEKPEPRLVNV
jgi:hypothetical protein